MGPKPDLRLVIFAATRMVAGATDRVTEGISAEDGTMLPELDLIEKAIGHLKLMRDTVLRHERDVVGTGFEEIGKATGLHPSTWRWRHDPSIKAAKR